MTNTSNSKQPANKPIFRKHLPGGISAAVFENTRDGKTYRSLNVQRSYWHNDKWNRKSIYLDHQDIPFLQEVLNGVWRFLNEFPAGTSGENDGDVAGADDTVDESSPAEA